METTSRHVMVTTTCNTPASRDVLVKALLDAKVVACVQVSEVNSSYWWKGAQTQDAEYMLTCKTRAELLDKVERVICDNHVYETPQVVVIPMLGGSKAYLDWMDEVTR